MNKLLICLILSLFFIPNFASAQLGKAQQYYDLSVVVTSPKLGDIWVRGNEYAITWQSETKTSELYTLALSPEGSPCTIQDKDSDKVVCPMIAYEQVKIAESLPGSGSIKWVVPKNLQSYFENAHVDIYSSAGTASGTSGSIKIINPIKPILSSGAAIKSQQDPTIYLIMTNGLKIAFPNVESFYSYNLSFSQVNIIDEVDLVNYPTAKYLRLDGSGVIYKVESGKRRPITQSAWSNLGAPVNEMADVNYTTLNSYELGNVFK